MSIFRATDRVGQVLGGRYRLLAPIGTGASATVYLADDVVLRRRVAVKVLHDALAGDPSFLKRFRAEAQAAAALNHPHIVAVHDWGQGDVPYLVTELLEGGSLRDLLDSGVTLSPAQARQIGIEAARALDYAHRRGFVHRDIKPANLLFDSEGMLRVADFGLARALAEAAWTEPAGAVLGTARYASPEQAQGAVLDGRSDVYSLGLVLVESMTGEVPFATDTALGTLMARVDRPVPVPDSVGPLASALRAAGEPDRGNRPDAALFTTMLLAAGDSSPVAPLPIVGMRTLAPDALDPREPTTIYVSEREVVGIDPTIAVGAGVGAGAAAIPTGDVTIAVPAVQPPTRVIERELPGSVDDFAPFDAPRRRIPWSVIGVIVALLLVAGAAVAFAATRTTSHDVVDVVGLSYADAAAQMDALKFKVDRTDIYDERVPAEQVTAQDPQPGTSLAEGRTVTLTVSLGPPPVPVPTDLAGKTIEQATASLTAAGFRLGALTDVFDESIAKGVVLGVTQGVAAQMPKGSAIPLDVSAGPKPRTIPDGLTGQPYDAVAAKLTELGLKPTRDDQYSDTVAEGMVVSTNPAAGATAAKGSAVTVVVSKGKAVTIPAVGGKSCTDYATALRGLGLVVTINPFGTVVSGVTPTAGTQVKPGSAVTVACR